MRLTEFLPESGACSESYEYNEENMKKILLAIGCVVFVAGALRAEILEQILVKVNGEILTKTDLEKLQIAAIRERSAANPASLNDAELAKAIADVTPQVIV